MTFFDAIMLFTHTHTHTHTGIIMCEAATGQKPFTDLCVNNPVCMVMKLVMGVRPSFNGGVPSAYRSVTEKCWAGDPDLRPSFPDVQKQLAKLC